MKRSTFLRSLLRHTPVVRQGSVKQKKKRSEFFLDVLVIKNKIKIKTSQITLFFEMATSFVIV